MIGILSIDEVKVVGHSLFANFRLALQNYLQTSFLDVNTISELESIDILIIVDEHYSPHKKIWQNDLFIDKLNDRNIKVLIFNFEKIYNSQFPWNINIQKSVERINNKLQFVADVADSTILNCPLNKQLLSKDTFLSIPKENKNDEILFVGQINDYYPNRRKLLNSIQKINDKVKIIKTDRRFSYEEFIQLINDSKYVLNPLGTGEFINLRFYEALNLGCVVIQQYTDQMADKYPELNQANVLKFRNLKEFQDLDFDLKYKKEDIFLEDYFNEIDLFKLMKI